jgi:hypothetical protein
VSFVNILVNCAKSIPLLSFDFFCFFCDKFVVSIFLFDLVRFAGEVLYSSCDRIVKACDSWSSRLVRSSLSELESNSLGSRERVLSSALSFGAFFTPFK